MCHLFITIPNTTKQTKQQIRRLATQVLVNPKKTINTARQNIRSATVKDIANSLINNKQFINSILPARAKPLTKLIPNKRLGNTSNNNYRINNTDACEAIVSDGSGLQIIPYTITPTNEAIFPRVARIAQMFNKFQIHNLSFEFTPSVGTNIGTGGSIGNYALAEVSDPADAPPKDFTSVRNLTHKTTSVLYIPASLNIHSSSRTFYTGSGDSATVTTTIREQSPGQFVIAFKYNATTFPEGVEFGYLSTKYDLSLLEFFLPQNAPLPVPTSFHQSFGSFTSLTSIRALGDIPFSFGTANTRFKIKGNTSYIVSFSVQTAGDLSDITVSMNVPDSNNQYIMGVNAATPSLCNTDLMDKVSGSNKLYQYSQAIRSETDQTLTVSYSSSAALTNFAFQIVEILPTVLNNQNFFNLPTTGPTSPDYY